MNMKPETKGAQRIGPNVRSRDTEVSVLLIWIAVALACCVEAVPKRSPCSVSRRKGEGRVCFPGRGELDSQNGGVHFMVAHGSAVLLDSFLGTRFGQN